MATKTPSPVKRHNALVRFSKEHHYGLLLCWKIRQGVMDGIEERRIADYVLYFFDAGLKKHFEEEEKTLFVKLSPENDLRKQAEREHEAINGIISNIRKGVVPKDNLLVFADTLEKHIRFEERVLFNHLQQRLPEDELLELMNNHSDNAGDSDSGWADKFWLGKI